MNHKDRIMFERIIHIDEPTMVFGNNQLAKDPRVETPDIVYHPRRVKVTIAGRTKVTHPRRAKVTHL